MIIAFCGKKGSGKGLASERLIFEHGFNRYSFAGPLKEACKHIFLFDDEQVNGDQREVVDERWGVTPRKILQVLGTELFQYDIHKYMDEGEFDVGRSIWVKRFEFVMEKNPSANIVISDLRFQHEADKVRELGGYVVKIRRSEVEGGSSHPSEKELEEIEGDVEIQNDGTVPELKENVDSIVQKIGGP